MAAAALAAHLPGAVRASLPDDLQRIRAAGGAAGVHADELTPGRAVSPGGPGVTTDHPIRPGCRHFRNRGDHWQSSAACVADDR
jgi:hypothetical protein